MYTQDTWVYIYRNNRQNLPTVFPRDFSMQRVLLLLLSVIYLSTSAAIKQPKLILQLTIDQFSGNQLTRFKQHIDNGGFNILLKHGIWYDNAHQDHATTETAVGHTTLATGTPPAIHGIIANQWWSPMKKKLIYALDDEQFGASPRNILTPGFADSLSMATLGKAKRFAVSAKDRGAIPLAGKMGKAFWYNLSNGQYHSSGYYYKHSPKWAKLWNNLQLSDQFKGKVWTMKLSCGDYDFCDDHRFHLVSNDKAYGQAFPHPYGETLNDAFYGHIYDSPESDALTLSFASALLKGEKLGKHKTPDYLSVSLSATDAIGHRFGPYSLESEDNFIRLNENLGKFLATVDKQVGLNNTLIVLSADHGAGPSPSYLRNLHLNAKEIDDSDLEQTPAVKKLLKQIGGLELSELVTINYPELYFNEVVLKSHHLNREALAHQLALALSQTDGLLVAASKFDVLHNHFSSPGVDSLLKQQTNAKRSGDIYLVTMPHIYFGNKQYNHAHHGTPWIYDTHVPVIFSHPSFKPKRIHRRVRTIDVAPTLASLVHIDPPAESTGEVLTEVAGG